MINKKSFVHQICFKKRNAQKWAIIQRPDTPAILGIGACGQTIRQVVLKIEVD